MTRILLVPAVLLFCLEPARGVELRPSGCRSGSLQYLVARQSGHAAWSDSGTGAFVGRSEDRAEVELPLVCTVNLPASADGVNIQLGTLRVTFDEGSGNDSGVVILLVDPNDRTPLWSLKALRMAGESWIELPARSHQVQLRRKTSKVRLELRLIDRSPQAALRVDISSIAITGL